MTLVQAYNPSSIYPRLRKGNQLPKEAETAKKPTWLQLQSVSRDSSPMEAFSFKMVSGLEEAELNMVVRICLIEI